MTIRDATPRRKAPTWAVLAPVEPEALERIIAGEDDEGAFLRVERGEERYHAVVSEEPGSEGKEEEVAATLSRSYPGPHYALVLDPEYAHVRLFEGGRFVRAQRDDPGALARRLGCPVVPAEAGRPEPDWAVIVADTSPDRVKAALGPDRALRDAVDLRSGPVGTIARSGRPGLLMDSTRLSRELGATVYVVVRFADQAYFRCWVVENGKELGVLDRPSTAWSAQHRLAEVLGQSTPEGILAALGVEL